MAKAAQKHFYSTDESRKQNAIYLGVLILVALVLWPLAPRPNSEAVGVLLPQTNQYPAISPDQVQVVSSIPSGAQRVGEINTKIHYSSTSNLSDDDNLQKCLSLAKILAAQYGANFVVVDTVGRTIEDNPLDGFVVYSGAYHD